MHLLHAILGQNALTVRHKFTRHKQLAVDHAVTEKILHHLALRGLAIRPTDEVGAIDLRHSWAGGKLAAGLVLCFGRIWGAFLADEVAVLSEQSGSKGPAAIAALSHIVA